MAKDLIEKIGIDKSEIKDFWVLYVDFLKLRKHDNVILEGKEGMAYELKDGKSFGKLQINDNVWFGTFLVEMRKGGNGCFVYTKMDVFVGNEETGNLNNLSVMEYKERIEFIKRYLQEEYGVFIDICKARIRKMEINCTFEIAEEFYKYHRALRLMMFNMSDDSEKTMTVEKNNKKEQSIESETFYYGNNRWQIKIYDKKRQLEDTMGYECDIYIMRIEIILKNSQKVNEVIKKKLLLEITDDMIVNFFMKQFRNLVEKKYKKWRKDNKKQLNELITFHKRKSRNNWHKNLLNECRNTELKKRVPIILELDDLFEQIKLLEKGRHFSRVKKSIENICEEDDVFLQNDSKKIEEIISKVNRIYDDYINEESNVVTVSGEC